MVRLRTLTPSIEVRILAGHPPSAHRRKTRATAPFRKRLLKLIGPSPRGRRAAFPFENVTRGRPRFEDVPADLKRRILARNRLDIALYDHVRSTRERPSLLRRFSN